jgi:hypothetical protein
LFNGWENRTVGAEPAELGDKIAVFEDKSTGFIQVRVTLDVWVKWRFLSSKSTWKRSVCGQGHHAPNLPETFNFSSV